MRRISLAVSSLALVAAPHLAAAQTFPTNEPMLKRMREVSPEVKKVIKESIAE